LQYDADNGERKFWLDSAAPGVDSGVAVPNFNDEFVGLASDIGAFERGAPALRYGVEAGRGQAVSTEVNGPTGMMDSIQPDASALGQSYPNPFNSGTVIPFSLATDLISRRSYRFTTCWARNWQLWRRVASYAATTRSDGTGAASRATSWQAARIYLH
jgi:hypothetical protein